MEFHPVDNTTITPTCIICGNDHIYTDCHIQITNNVPDKEVPSRAKLSLPDFLKLQILTDGSYSVATKSPIAKGTQFGPFVAKKATMPSLSQHFLLKVHQSDVSEVTEFYLDTSDENECNWLIFISIAENLDEQNLICYETNKEIYYVAIKDIESESTLKVWYSPFYAQKIKRKPLSPIPTNDDSLENIDIDNLIRKQQNIMERKIWTCKFCSTLETKVAAFAKHIFKHYDAQLRNICEICDCQFTLKKSLQNHLKIVHCPDLQSSACKGAKNKNKATVEGTGTSKAQYREPSLGGPLLNDLFTDSSDLHNSELEQFDINVVSQNLLLDDDSLNVENLFSDNVRDLDHFNFEIEENNKHYVCDICLKPFAKLKLFLLHLRFHTGEFTCCKCLKVFCRRENLKSHICCSTTLFECDICKKKFMSKKYLTRHITAKHNGKHMCNHCNKCYFSNKELLEHNCSQIPAVEKKEFVCPICSKIFFRMSYLKKHLIVHQNSDNNGMCAICGEVFKDKNSIYLHMKSHQSPTYTCDICSKTFFKFDILKEHKLRHQQSESAFTCTECGKKLKSRKILKLHMETHNKGDEHKPLKCNFCNEAFKQPIRLQRHMKKHKENANETQLSEYYRCPVCHLMLKHRSSVARHIRRVHPSDVDKIKIDKQCGNISAPSKSLPTDNDLNKDSNNCIFANEANSLSMQNDFDTNITNFLNGTANDLCWENLKSRPNDQALDRLVEELNSNAKVTTTELESAKEICLSIPDLTEKDEEITLGKNAYILANGTIVQPQEDSDKVIVYVLNQTFS